MKSGLAQSLSERSPKKGNHFQKAVSPLPKFASSWGHSLPACRLPHKLNSAALCVLLLPGVVVIRYETTATARWALLFIVRAFFDDTITVAVWTGFHARLMGMLPHPATTIRWCFSDSATAETFAVEFDGIAAPTLKPQPMTDELMTAAQAATLKQLAQDAYELDAFKPNLTRPEADKRIAMLTAKLKLLDGPPHTL